MYTVVMQAMYHSEHCLLNGRVVAELVPASLYISSGLLDYLSSRNAALAQIQIQVRSAHLHFSSILTV